MLPEKTGCAAGQTVTAASGDARVIEYIANRAAHPHFFLEGGSDDESPGRSWVPWSRYDHPSCWKEPEP